MIIQTRYRDVLQVYFVKQCLLVALIQHCGCENTAVFVRQVWPLRSWMTSPSVLPCTWGHISTREMLPQSRCSCMRMKTLSLPPVSYSRSQQPSALNTRKLSLAVIDLFSVSKECRKICFWHTPTGRLCECLCSWKPMFFSHEMVLTHRVLLIILQFTLLCSH